MYAILLNPPKKGRKLRKAPGRGRRKRRVKRRGRKKYTKRQLAARRRRSAAKARRTRARRSCAKRVKTAVQKVACGPAKRYRAIRRTCPTEVAKRARARKRRDPFDALPARYRKANNPPKRRRARYSYNPRRRRRRNYSHWIPAYKNPYWVPSYAMNPGAVGAIRTTFSVPTIRKIAPIASGAAVNRVVRGMVSGYLPEILQSGFPAAAVGLGTAAVNGFVAGMVNRQWLGPVTLGGSVEVVVGLLQEYVMPMIGLSGLGDYLTRANAAGARPLGGCCGMGSYASRMETQQYLPSFAQTTGLDYQVPSYAQATQLNNSMTGMGDYLTRQNAAEARALGRYKYNDGPMDAVQRSELAMSY